MTTSLHEVPELEEVSKPPVSEELREELQRFATRALRHELATLRSQLKQDFQTELQQHGFAKRGNTQHFPSGVTLPPLNAQDDSQQLRTSGWTTVYELPGVRPVKMETAKSDLIGDEGLDAGDQLKAPLPSNDLPVLPTSELPHQVERPPSRDLAMLNQAMLQDCDNIIDAPPVEVWQPFFGAERRHSKDSTKAHENAFSLFKAGDKPGQVKKWGRARTCVKDLSELESETSMRVNMNHRRKTYTKLRLRAVVKAKQGSLLGRCCDLLSDFIESGISFVIVLNGIFIGVQTDYQARNVTESVPSIFPIMETIFCVIFTLELIVKLMAYRLRFFYTEGWPWNIFDMFLVISQLMEVVGIILAKHETSESGQTSEEWGQQVGSISFLRLLRVLRLLRILRLVRLLRFVGELATIISSIANCLRALCWSVLLLLMMIYIVGVFFAQIVFSYRVGLSEDSEPLDTWWGSLSRSIFTLYQAILGGVDWETVSTPLEEISPACSLVFCFYIAFSMLAMMNIITGTFVQSALKSAENERTRDFRNAARSAFVNEDDYDGTICYEDFVDKIEGEPLKHWIDNMGIELQDAKLLYRLLEAEDEDEVQTERLVTSLIALREGAKFIDIMKLMYELKHHAAMMDEWWDAMETTEHEITAMKCMNALPPLPEDGRQKAAKGSRPVRGGGFTPLKIEEF